MIDSRLVRRWVGATWAGWLLGIPIIVALALAAEVAGIGGAQVMVGAGTGAGVGLMQGRLMRGIINSFAPWIWSSVIGLALPFLIYDLTKVGGREVAFNLYVSVAVGGLVAGVWQAWLLRARFRNTIVWVFGALLGWTLAGSAAAGADLIGRSQSIRGIAGALVYLGIIAAGGLILGATTGITLGWLKENELAEAKPTVAGSRS